MVKWVADQIACVAIAKNAATWYSGPMRPAIARHAISSSKATIGTATGHGLTSDGSIRMSTANTNNSSGAAYCDRSARSVNGRWRRAATIGAPRYTTTNADAKPIAVHADPDD